ncbi:hypothetical protein AWB91_09060 [Mycobacterium paraense]|uniref:Uncharacterized protein n=1 Tax=Mycobacterium paraense TaxID=767916 RepID=A0ABX3VS24_9MYCO|nr:hypothetical protein [Mycobacterium paraense]ORW33265.1 hypothetical protein AWB91_09060 [Mycobacterium paraense]ORW34674.1 hypothetical protein AWB88_02715 [Mycobacterium paraense]
MSTTKASEQGTREAQREQTAAKKFDARLRTKARNAEDAIAEVNALIGEAIEKKTYVLLGFQTWQQYVSDVISKEMPQLGAIARNSLIKFLTAKGMSRRQVATATNTSVGTVNNVANGSSQGDPANQAGKGGARKGAAQTRRNKADLAIAAIEDAVKAMDKFSQSDFDGLLSKLQAATKVVKAGRDAYVKRQRQIVADEAAKDARKAANSQGTVNGTVHPSADNEKVHVTAPAETVAAA